MSFSSGHGGKIGVGSTFMPTTTWRLKKTSVLADTTNSSGGGYKSYLNVVRDSEGSCDFVIDFASLPEGIFTEGTTCTLLLYRGASGTFFSLTAIIESIEWTCDNRTDVVRGTITFKGIGAVSVT